MSAEPFVHTNIWVYAHTAQTEDIRGPLARALVDDGRRFVISTQILSEYYSAMLKNRAADSLIQDNIDAMILRCDVLLIDTATIRTAHKLKLRYGFSYWDSLVVATALQGDCGILYSEDLQDGKLIEERLRVVNPLKAAATRDCR